MEREGAPESKTEKQTVIIGLPWPEDAEAIRRVQAETWYATYVDPERGVTLEGLKHRQEGERGEKIEKKREFWKKQIESSGDNHAVFIARDGDEVVGFIAPSIMDGQRQIGALYLLPEAQGRGVGARLLQQALVWHGEEKDVYLHVAEGNQKTIAFYEKFGFKMTGKRFEDDGPEDARIPELEMVREGKSPEIMNPEVSIKECTEEDIAVLDEAIANNRDWHRKRFESQQRGETSYLIAWEGEVPVGHLNLIWGGSNQDEVRKHVKGCPELNAIGIWPPEKRSHGIGRKLIAQAEEMARHRGYEQVGLGVEVANERAKELYEKLGYLDWGHGIYHDKWTQVKDDGTSVEHNDPCYYLIKKLPTET